MLLKIKILQFLMHNVISHFNGGYTQSNQTHSSSQFSPSKVTAKANNLLITRVKQNFFYLSFIPILTADKNTSKLQCESRRSNNTVWFLLRARNLCECKRSDNVKWEKG